MSSKIKKEFNIFGNIEDNIEFFLLESTSDEINSLIKSKLEKYKSSKEFFKHYTNHEIDILFEHLSKMEKIYLSICSCNHNDASLDIMDSKIDEYISYLSNLILIYNLISNNKQIIKKVIKIIESKMNNFYNY